MKRSRLEKQRQSLVSAYHSQPISNEARSPVQKDDDAVLLELEFKHPASPEG